MLPIMIHNDNFFKDCQYLSKWDPNKKIPKVQVVTAFLQYENKFLILQRERKDLQHSLWGIPGGKLEKDELPLSGLLRELHEELNVNLSYEAFQLLGTAISLTPADGEYGLYIYHTHVLTPLNIQINREEHSAFLWVTIDEFQKFNLLTAQREAFYLVQNKLIYFLSFINPVG